jgi:dolichyl-diphosphooligosaccharide--protein glycosyltransferase
VITEQGYYEFHNWFDSLVWYPLGRIVGTTIFPGLMATAGLAHWLLHLVNVPVSIRNVCVILSPAFASFTAWITFAFAREVGKSPRRSGEAVGLTAAALVAVVPGYVSRSVAGSYDNEAVAIFALVNTFFMFMRAVNTGSLLWAGLSSVAYYYMVAAWGGYVFLANIIPLYALVMVLSGRFSHRLYVAYNTWYILGTIYAMQVAFVGFQPVSTSEHLLPFLVFGMFQVIAAFRTLGAHLPRAEFIAVLRLGGAAVASVAAFMGAVLWATGYVAPWTGRFYSLLDPLHLTFVGTQLVKSVSEHQPPAWSSFFFDFHFLMVALPAGVYMCFRDVTDGSVFAIVYALMAMWFSGSMVRLMLVLAPVMAVVGGIALSETLQAHAAILKGPAPASASASASASGADAEASGAGKSGGSSASTASSAASKTASTPEQSNRRLTSLVVLIASCVLLSSYATHCTYVTSEAYSSPSIVLSARSGAGRVIFDDYREAYFWIRQNTAPDAKILSWWDYGYQLASMANRTTIVDNNTWNNTHIATVGYIMASPEKTAYQMMRRLDVDYVLVIFGGALGYGSDDIAKFLWMARISGGVFPQIKEADYLSGGRYSVGADVSKAMRRSMMFKMCYHRFGDHRTDYGRAPGWDRVRNQEIPQAKNIKLKYISEAYTTEHWLVRVYAVNKPHNRKTNW